jgi:tRNA(fMet)-specific endonuclease VapC
MVEPAYLLDTKICIYLLRGESAAAAGEVQRCSEGEIVTSAITCAEVMIGARAEGGERDAEAFFRLFPALPFDGAAAHAYAGLPFRRGSFDRLIAAHALALGLTLVTNNERDVADIPGLAVENWAR